MRSEMAALLSPEQVLSGEAVQRAYDCDAYTVEKSRPTIVVLPHSTEEVATIVRWCNVHGIPFTPRGAGTGLSGGSLPALGGVVISTKKMTAILEIDVPNRQLKAQAGIANKKISDAVAKEGLHFAPDPSSQAVSTLGGNIAENSGGPHTLKYGVTTQHVLEVTMVSPEGDILTIGSRTPGAPGPDLLGLIVGGEGTLGLVTEAWVKLTPLPAAIFTCLAAFPSVRAATETVAAITNSGVVPAAVEMMDHGIMAALKAAFGLDYPAGAKALLLIECDAPPPTPPLLAGDVRATGGRGGRGVRVGAALESPDISALAETPSPPTPSPSAAQSSAQGEGEIAAHQVLYEGNLVTKIAREHGAIQIDVAETEADRLKLWTARKKGIGAMGRLAPTIVTHDGVIPRSKLPEMLDFVYEVARKYELNVANLFHAGDGNLHPCFYFDDRIPGVVDRVAEAGEAIIRRCIELGGSITGEHGVGVEKLDLMSLMYTPADLDLQRRMKLIFNEGELCNACKVLPNQKGCVEHRMRWKGAAW